MGRDHPLAEGKVLKPVKLYLGLGLLVAASSALAMTSMRCPKLSDEEVLGVAIASVVATHSTGYVGFLRRSQGSVGEIRAGFEPFTDVDEFRRLNPECCVLSDVGTEGYRMSFLGRLRHSFQTFVIMDYSIKSDSGTGTRLVPLRSTMSAVSSCGYVIDLF